MEERLVLQITDRFASSFRPSLGWNVLGGGDEEFSGGQDLEFAHCMTTPAGAVAEGFIDEQGSQDLVSDKPGLPGADGDERRHESAEVSTATARMKILGDCLGGGFR